MGKQRRWQAVITVSASGPEHCTVFENNGYYLRPRMAADLRYTTADIDFYEKWAQDQDYDSCEFELHQRLVNPTKQKLMMSIKECSIWFHVQSKHKGWDGGGLLFCFAGHGCEGDGALVLEDGILTPIEFGNVIASVAESISLPNRLRVSVILDSCHSGAFATRILHDCFNKHKGKLIPFNVFASCVDDEVSWEESDLGHGVFTYTFSVREASLGSLSATAVQPDNTFGPSISLAKGELGCSLLTAGAQNPIAYWNGSGHLEVGGQSFSVFPNDGACMPLAEMRSKIRALRNRFSSQVKLIRCDRSIGRLTGGDMQRSVRELRASLENFTFPSKS